MLKKREKRKKHKESCRNKNSGNKKQNYNNPKRAELFRFALDLNSSPTWWVSPFEFHCTLLPLLTLDATLLQKQNAISDFGEKLLSAASVDNLIDAMLSICTKFLT